MGRKKFNRSPFLSSLIDNPIFSLVMIRVDHETGFSKVNSFPLISTGNLNSNGFFERPITEHNLSLATLVSSLFLEVMGEEREIITLFLNIQKPNI